MWQAAQGIPNLPDLTHPNELIQFGKEIIQLSEKLAIFVVLLGIVIALLHGSHRRRNEPLPIVGEWLGNYFFLLGKLPHFALILTLLLGGFLMCSTLANRYHHWEQSRVSQVAQKVSGDRLEQPAPVVRYVVKEPYTYDNWVEGKQVRVESTRDIDKYMAIAGSQIDVNINQTTDTANLKQIYSVVFQADYKVVNQLKETVDFFFEVRPPAGYTLMQNFKVERDGSRLVSVNPGDYGFPLRLNPGEETNFRVTYQAQGGSRWVYDANGQLLSNFRLTALANFPMADFASGIVPTESKVERRGTRFTWVFDDNVSVRNPFGVFTATDRVRNTGVLPRLLLLAPALFLWWIMLLYLSLPMSMRDVAIAGGIFFACLLTLTYLSRFLDVTLAWTFISLVLLGLVWGLGKTKRTSLAAMICTIAGGVLPVLGLIVPYSGITLSLAALLSVAWLAVRHWYGWYQVRSDEG